MSGRESSGANSPKRRQLDGWEEIAEYLGKDPKTVGRWEKKESLPVYREGRCVFAFADELDTWRARRICSPKGQRTSQPCSQPAIAVAEPPEPEEPDEFPNIEPSPLPRQHWAVLGRILFATSILLVLLARGDGRPNPRPPEIPFWGRLLAKATSENSRRLAIGVSQIPRLLTITPDGNRLFAADGNSRLVSVLVPSRGEIGQIDVRSDVRVMTMSPDGRRLYIGTSTGGVTVVDTLTRHIIDQVPTAGEIFDQAITPDGGKLFLTMSHKGLWRMLTASHELKEVADQECPETVTVGPDQKVFVGYQCGGPGGRPGHDTIEILDYESERRLATVSGLPLVAGTIAPSQDGHTLLVDGGDACMAPQYDHVGCEIVPSDVVHVLRLPERQYIRSIPFPPWTNLKRFVDRSHVLLDGRRLSVLDTSHYVESERLEREGLGISGVAIDSAHSTMYLGRQGAKEILRIDAESADCSPIERNLVAFYSGDGVMNDMTGGMSLHPVGTVGFTPGRVGQAFQFDGVTGYLRGPVTGRDPFGSRDSSFLAYVKFASKEGEQTILDRVCPETPLSAHLWKSREGRIVFDIAARAAQASVMSRFDIVPERWYHIAITKTDQEVVLYIDGIAEARASLGPRQAYAPLPGDSPLFLGATHQGRKLLRGKLDEILLYNRALTDTEIQTLFRSRESGPCRI